VGAIMKEGTDKFNFRIQQFSEARSGDFSL
jgi:hypothetical protein